jgi:hypothetical protein
MRFPTTRNGLRRLQIAAAAGGAASVLFAGPAAAASTIGVSPETVQAGGAVVISGQVPATGRASCPAEDPTILASTVALFPLLRAPRSASGAFRVHYRVPRSARAGVYRISATCGGRRVCSHATLRVVAALVMRVPPSASRVRGAPGTLANGGRWWVIAGTLLIGVSVFLGVAEWRPWQRRRT